MGSPTDISSINTRWSGVAFGFSQSAEDEMLGLRPWREPATSRRMALNCDVSSVVAHENVW